jgi:hypothetical protein
LGLLKESGQMNLPLSAGLSVSVRSAEAGAIVVTVKLKAILSLRHRARFSDQEGHATTHILETAAPSWRVHPLGASM